MLVLKAYKTEIDPNNVQRTLLAKHAGTARYAWNWGLSRRIAEYQATGQSSNAIEQHRQLNALKAECFPWMYEVSKCAPQEALRDLDQAFQHFFRRCSEGKGKVGFPKFKRKKRGLGGFRLTGRIAIASHQIQLPRLGWLRLKESNYLPVKAKINSVTVRERAGRWFVSVQVEEEIAVSDNQGEAIGLDLGLKSLIVGSDGSALESPKPLNRSLKRLRKLSRQHSGKQKGSQNRKKSARKLAKLHYRISCQRADFLHKATSELARNKSLIAVENLKVSGMLKNHCLARSISDAGWSELVRQLEYKSLWHGSQLVKIDRFFPSSKVCSGCGAIKDELPLSERRYHCEVCGLVMDRDLNAARNILHWSMGSSPRIDASEDQPVGAVVERGTERFSSYVKKE